MLGLAGWFFTFALRYGDKGVVLMDRFDARRQRLSGRKLPAFAHSPPVCAAA